MSLCPHHEPPAVVRRRRVAVAIIVVIGATLLGYSLGRHPGDTSLLSADAGAGGRSGPFGALASAPLHLGRVRFRGRNQRPVISGTIIGLALGGVFVAGRADRP